MKIHKEPMHNRPSICSNTTYKNMGNKHHILCVQQQSKIQSVKREEPIAFTNARNALNNPHKIPLNTQKTVRIISGLRLEVRREAGTAMT